VALAHVAAGTSSIRIGAGGIMLPNHAPLLIAEQFGTLAALHPWRVELGLGRAPGSDQITARAMRRTLHSTGEEFPQDVIELMGYFQPVQPGQPVQAVPGAGLDVPIWILGSSTFGAQLAAVWMDLSTTARERGMGTLAEIRVVCARGTVLCRSLPDGYYVALLVGSGSPSAFAAFALRRAAAEIASAI